ncbi:MAG: carboxypeptidase-like regulatory domain-containing protein [Pirellulaceae bacterium]
MARTGLLLIVGAVVGIAVGGCSKSSLSGLEPVKGTVTKGGQPLEGANVTFHPAGTTGIRAATGVTDAAGVFTLTTLQPGDGAMPGNYNVTIGKTETIGKLMTQEEGNAYYQKYQKPPPIPETKNLVDMKYSHPVNSGLKASVKKGEENNFSFTVE